MGSFLNGLSYFLVDRLLNVRKTYFRGFGCVPILLFFRVTPFQETHASALEFFAVFLFSKKFSFVFHKMGKSKNKGKGGKGQFVAAPPRTAFEEDEPRIVELPADYDEGRDIFRPMAKPD